MNLQLIARSPYVLLPSGVLIVEPHEGLLAARALLLATADDYVGVSGSSGMKAPQVRCDGYEVAVAILSESLGRGLLTTTAQDVRQAWPHARILIFVAGVRPLRTTSMTLGSITWRSLRIYSPCWTFSQEIIGIEERGQQEL